MTVAVACPACESARINAVERVWFMHGWVLLARYGSRTVVGCESCVRRAVWRNLLVCALAGWWSIPWGLLTPVVLVQNLLRALWPHSEEWQRAQLSSLLEDIGIDSGSVEVDGEGFTLETRALTLRLCAVLHEAMSADTTHHEEEIAYAAGTVARFTDGLWSEATARRHILAAAQPLGVDSSLAYEERLMLLQAAVGVVAADGTFHPAEREFVLRVGSRLGFPPGVVERTILEIVYGQTFADDSLPDDVLLACATLGVGSGASFAEIRQKFREVMLRHHPDVAARHGVAAQEAEEIAKRLNWAYDVLKRHAGTEPAAA